MFPRVEGFLQRLIRYAAEGNRLLLVCLALAIGGTLGAAYPITSVVVPAVLLVPQRWRSIAGVAALGSAIGATALVIFFHHLGWEQLYERYPELAAHPTWGRVMHWTQSYGALALFAVAALPLPQTPALIFFAIARPDYFSVFVAILAGKTLKYLLFAWLAARFPGRIGNGLGALLRRRTDKDSRG